MGADVEPGSELYGRFLNDVMKEMSQKAGQKCTATRRIFVPEDMLDLYEAMKATDLAAAQAIHYRLLPLFDVLFCETNPIPVKAALAAMGMMRDE